MYKTKTYSVVPAIPEPISDLRRLAYNLWWTWNWDAVALFQRLDRNLWNRVGHNPIELLAALSQTQLQQAAEDSAYLAHLDRVLRALNEYLGRKTWFEKTYPDLAGKKCAYFSMEFGLHECLPLYSGGLGGLAGDHMKAASDLGVPLTGIGLFYHQGYFQQFLSNDGWQFEDYPTLNVDHMPVLRVRDDKGKPITVHIPLADRTVAIQLFRIIVGRTSVILLDTNLPENHADDRACTMQLYGGDQEMRIRQECILGFGGCAALRALGEDPVLFHMNEGHSAFLALERVFHLITEEKLSFAEASEAVAGSMIFTTHTPVPAGIDTFPHGLVHKYLSPFAEKMGVAVADLIGLGQTHPGSDTEPFSMATLALRLSYRSNGVSKRHGEVARDMWRANWPEVPVEEIPITSVTNGVHIQSWLSPEIEHLLERYLGPDWTSAPDDADLWKRVEDIPDAELWRAHERCRERQIVDLRNHLRRQMIRRGAPASQIEAADEMFNPEALTIGFARRFAPYKRATLLLRDEARLIKMLTDTERPIQFIFSGKAHPRDDMGKELIKKLIQFGRRPDARYRFAFIENYNINVARNMVQGVDLWMNNPTKPLEASGTSGMKAAPNGGLNFSVLDGWWCEGYDGTNGWTIGDDRVYDNPDYQAYVESESIYEMLEREIIPCFYDRGADGLPRNWIKRMKASIRKCGPQFSAARMVREYASRLYVPVARNGLHLRQDHYDAAKSLARWRAAIGKRWQNVGVESFDAEDGKEIPVGRELKVRAEIRLADIKPEEVLVQLYHGPVPADEVIHDGQAVDMQCQGSNGKGLFVYNGSIPCTRSGRHAYAVRLIPRHPNIPGHRDLTRIKWG